MVEIGQGVRPSMALELTPREKNGSSFTPHNLFLLSREGPSWWVRVDGKLVALGGYIVQWSGRAILWGYVDKAASAAALPMTREVRRQLARIDADRIEAYAGVRQREARRWIMLLGFRKEGVMRKFVNGQDYVLFARTR